VATGEKKPGLRQLRERCFEPDCQLLRRWDSGPGLRELLPVIGIRIALALEAVRVDGCCRRKPAAPPGEPVAA
jgi:hypothetical protein